MDIKIDIDLALAALRKNLTEHTAELVEARKNWTDDVITSLEKLRDAVNRKGLDAAHTELFTLFSTKPRDSRAEYSRYIGALEVAQKSGQTQIETDEYEYDRMFNDNWDWRVASKTTNATYTRNR